MKQFVRDAWFALVVVGYFVAWSWREFLAGFPHRQQIIVAQTEVEGEME